MSRLDYRIASRYLRSRRSSRLVSLITIIAAGGVTIGVMALIIEKTTKIGRFPWLSIKKA